MLNRANAVICAGLLATTSAAAQDSLYPEAPPDDAVFVRWLGSDDATSVPVFGQELRAEPEFGTAYIAISASELSGAEAGVFVTVVSEIGGHAHVINEPPRQDASKVQLLLLNTSADPVRLIAQGPGAEVIAPVATGDAGIRSVNPVAVTLAVERVGDGKVLGSFDLRLSRGRNLTFLALGDGAELIENSFGPVMSLR